MRKYQRRLVSELRVLYQSNDPLRWLYIGTKIKCNRRITERERKIFMRRIADTAKDAFKMVTETFQNITVTMQQAANNMRSLVGAIVDSVNNSK